MANLAPLTEKEIKLSDALIGEGNKLEAFTENQIRLLDLDSLTETCHRNADSIVGVLDRAA